MKKCIAPRRNLPRPESLVIGNADRACFFKALEQLPVEWRETLILREFEGLSYREIAAVTDTPIGTVMSRLARARTRLENILTQMTQAPKQGGPSWPVMTRRELLDGYLDDELDVTTNLELRHHLQECQDCAELHRKRRPCVRLSGTPTCLQGSGGS